MASDVAMSWLAGEIAKIIELGCRKQTMLCQGMMEAQDDMRFHII